MRAGNGASIAGSPARRAAAMVDPMNAPDPTREAYEQAYVRGPAALLVALTDNFRSEPGMRKPSRH